MRAFCDQTLEESLEGRVIRQINHSRTSAVGALRGLHYQIRPYAEMKMIRCIRGAVYDVAVDIRADSQTFLQHYAMTLSANNHYMMIIPEGFAHGFQSLEANSELLYIHTAPYAKDYEEGLRFDDPALEIEWPLPVSDISARDLAHPVTTPNFSGIEI